MKSIPRAWLLLPFLLSGCAAAERATPGPESVPVLFKVESGEPELRQAIARTGRVYSAAEAARGTVRRDGPCWFLRPPADAETAGLGAEDWNAHWQGLLADLHPEAIALLKPIRGVDAFLQGQVETLDAVRLKRGRLEICTAWTDQDLIERLRHPLLAAGQAADPAALQWVDVPGEAAIAALVHGRLDLALLNGRERERLSELDTEGEIATVPAEALDRRYWIVVDREARWVNDPRLPRWFSAELDRGELARIVTGSPQDACADLLCTNSDRRSIDRGPRPLAESSRPRLRMVFDATDPYAESISNRLVAKFATLGLDLQGIPLPDRSEVESEFRDGAAALALVVHDRTVEDMLLGLESVFRRLAGSLAPAGGRIRAHRRLADSTDRERAAEEWARAIAEDGQAIPILRVRRWLAYRTSALNPQSRFGAELLRRIGAEG